MSNSIMKLRETKTHHRNSMIPHGGKGETKTVCLRIVPVVTKKKVCQNS